MDKNILVASPANFEKEIAHIRKMYDNQMGIVHGFQKDVIQNAIGARPGNTFKNWMCTIDLVANEFGNFLLVTDHGTTGLTGANYSVDEIDAMSNSGETISPKEKLARISSRYNSGGNDFGGGLFGVGKTFYNIASKKLRYIFESNSMNEIEGYRCNINDRNKIMNKALEGDYARNFVSTETGLTPIKHVGTRFIIIDPIDDLITAMDTGELEKNIQETWWRIFSYFNDSEGIFLNGKKVEFPLQYLDTNHINSDKKELIETDYGRVRKVGFFVTNKLDDDLSGFYYYRKGMKIGKIILDNVPKAIEKRYYGYIEVDGKWENDLAEIEEGTHYDVNTTKKRHGCYRSLKNFVTEYVNGRLIEWRYISNKDNQNENIKKMFDEIKDELEDLFKSTGLEDLGTGDKKQDFLLRLNSVTYPNDDKTVYDGENISFGYTLKTTSNEDRKFKLQISTYNDDKLIHIIKSDEIIANKNKPYISNASLIISDKNSKKFSMNSIVINIQPVGENKRIQKKLNYYFSMESPKREKNDFLVYLYYKKMPKANTKRINFNEKISGIKYRVENNTTKKAKLNIRVSLHDHDNNLREIITHYRQEFSIESYHEEYLNVPDIEFSEKLFSQKMSKGKVIIRAEISAAERIGDYPKGFKFSKFDYAVLLNQNDKLGPFDAFSIHAVDGEGKKSRSWVNFATREIFINVKHPQYEESNEKGYLKEFVGELVTRHFLSYYLYAGKPSVISMSHKEMEEADIVDIICRLDEKIELTWWERWK